MFILLLFFGCLQGVKKRQTDDLKRFLGRLRKRVRPRLHHRTLLWFAHIRWSHPNVQTHQKNPVHNSWLCVVEEEKETKKKGNNGIHAKLHYVHHVFLLQTVDDSFQDGGADVGRGTPPVRCRASFQNVRGDSAAVFSSSPDAPPCPPPPAPGPTVATVEEAVS